MAIGIDFGFSEVKIVQIEKSSGGLALQNFGRKSVIDDLSKFNPESIGKSQWTAAIQELCRDLKINPKRIKNAVSSISGSNISIREVKTLDMAAEELASSLEFEAKKHIPMDGTQPVLDYHTLGSDPKELDKIIVLLVASTKNIIDNHNETMKEAGFKTGIFDADPIALVNAYTNAEGKTPEGADVLLDIGNQTTTLVVWGMNQRFFTRELSIAGHEFTKYTAKANTVQYDEAEKIKIAQGLAAVGEAPSEEGDDGKFRVQVAEKTIYTKLVEEVRKSLRFYMKNSGQSHFNKIYLSGGSAPLPGLQDFISENLNIKVELLNPFKKIENVAEMDNPAQYAIAFGCALRGLEKK
ncbi:MAG: type IV pilus assembly protein PilM [FCB group bacterium]|nr:type IV pilus assembly protein PilM [FCB group bacterium]